MKLYKVGEKSKAICEQCGQIRATTFKERNVPLSSGKGSVPNVLVAVCDTCDSVVSIPQQSAPRIQEVIHTTRHPIEARIPRHLIDALILVCYDLGSATSESKQSVVFRYYLQRISQTKTLHAKIKVHLTTDEAAGKSDARFSIKLNDELYAIFVKLEKQTKLSKSELVKGIIVQMKMDVLDDKMKEPRDELKELLLLAG